jgi:hypothetical protein
MILTLLSEPPVQSPSFATTPTNPIILKGMETLDNSLTKKLQNLIYYQILPTKKIAYLILSYFRENTKKLSN